MQGLTVLVETTIPSWSVYQILPLGDMHISFLQSETVAQCKAEIAVLDVFKRDGNLAVKIFWDFVDILAIRQTEIIASVKYNILVFVG